MKKFTFFSLFLLFINFSYGQDKTKGSEPDLSEAFLLIDHWLEAQKDYEGIPGISIAFIKDQELVYAKGYGESNPYDNVVADKNTIYSICSISKLFTAVAIMKLYDEGKLRLDDKVEDVLPWFDMQRNHESSGPITIRGLLSHSAGMPREAYGPYWSSPDFVFPSKEEVKKMLSSQEMLYPAATRYQYSNLGMTLLGFIVEEVSGMSYEDYVQKHIIDALELEDTRTNMPKELHGKQLAIGHGSPKRDRSRDKVNLFQAEGVTSAAGLSSTVVDLAKFASWQFRVLNGETEILKPSTLKDMQRVHFRDLASGVQRGLGFGVYQEDGMVLVGHGGYCPGYQSNIMLNPKYQSAMVVMANASGLSMGKFTGGIGKIIGRAFDEGPKSIDVDLSEYSGYYDSQPWWGEELILPWNGKLISVSLPSDNPMGNATFYKHIEGDTFRRILDNGDLAEKLEFRRDGSGKVVSAVQNYNISKKLR